MEQMKNESGQGGNSNTQNVIFTKFYTTFVNFYLIVSEKQLRKTSMTKPVILIKQLQDKNVIFPFYFNTCINVILKPNIKLMMRYVIYVTIILYKRDFS